MTKGIIKAHDHNTCPYNRDEGRDALELIALVAKAKLKISPNGFLGFVRDLT